MVSPPAGGFARFWTAYPKKVGKGAAARAWIKHRCEPETDTILDALTRHDRYLRRDEGQYTPNPATWLNERRWQDDPPDPGRPGDSETKRRTAGIQAWLEGGPNT